MRRDGLRKIVAFTGIFVPIVCMIWFVSTMEFVLTPVTPNLTKESVQVVMEGVWGEDWKDRAELVDWSDPNYNFILFVHLRMSSNEFIHYKDALNLTLLSFRDPPPSSPDGDLNWLEVTGWNFDEAYGIESSKFLWGVKFSDSALGAVVDDANYPTLDVYLRIYPRFWQGVLDMTPCAPAR